MFNVCYWVLVNLIMVYLDNVMQFLKRRIEIYVCYYGKIIEIDVNGVLRYIFLVLILVVVVVDSFRIC